MSKIQKLILVALSVTVVVLGIIFIIVAVRVNSVKFTITAHFDPLEYQSGVLINKTKPEAKRFVSNMGTFEQLEVAVFDLSDYQGADQLDDKQVVAYSSAGNLIPMTPNAMPCYNLDNCFIYGTKDQEKYLVDTDAKTVSPLLDTSSVNIEGVSTSGEFMLENDGKTVTVLRLKDRESREIISKTQVEIPQEYKSIDFIGWYNDFYALIKLNNIGSTSFAIVDGANATCTVLVTTDDTGSFVTEPDDQPKKDKVECYNELISDKFLQFYENVHDPVTNSYNILSAGRYMDIFTGTNYDIRLEREVFSGKNEIISISDNGEYAVIKTAFADDPYCNIEYVVFTSRNGKYYKLSDMIGNNVFIDDVYFVYNNVLVVNYAELSTQKEASCSIKLSF